MSLWTGTESTFRISRSQQAPQALRRPGLVPESIGPRTKSCSGCCTVDAGTWLIPLRLGVVRSRESGSLECGPVLRPPDQRLSPSSHGNDRVTPPQILRLRVLRASARNIPRLRKRFHGSSSGTDIRCRKVARGSKIASSPLACFGGYRSADQMLSRVRLDGCRDESGMTAACPWQGDDAARDPPPRLRVFAWSHVFARPA